MRLLERDKRDFWYTQYNGRTMILDSNGNPTGERDISYGEPQKCRGTFSLPTGAATPREFGNYIDYDYVVHIDEKPCPFDENAAIWLPGTDPTGEHDAKVMRISESASHVAIAVKKVR